MMNNCAPVVTAAKRFAAHSATFASLVIDTPVMPHGWFVDLPIQVFAGVRLSLHARQLFAVMARASGQLQVGLYDPAPLAGTLYCQFLEAPDWSLVQPPDSEFAFMFDWLLDPEYFALGNDALHLLALTRQRYIDFPDLRLSVDPSLDLSEIEAVRVERRADDDRKALDYYVQNGASPEMLRRMFPLADLSGVRLRPGRVAQIDLRTAQRLYSVWDDVCRTVAREWQRYVRLHEQFPAYSLASLYGAINDIS